MSKKQSIWVNDDYNARQVLREIRDIVIDENTVSKIREYFDFSSDKGFELSLKEVEEKWQPTILNDDTASLLNFSGDFTINANSHSIPLSQGMHYSIAANKVISLAGYAPFIVKNNNITQPPNPYSYWYRKLINSPHFTDVIKSVGTFYLTNIQDKTKKYIGTGFVLYGSNYVMTCDHVARWFSNGYKSKKKKNNFRKNLNGDILNVQFEFLKEHNVPTSKKSRVVDIKYLAPLTAKKRNFLDIALLEIEPSPLPKGIKLWSKPISDIRGKNPDFSVYTVGYPQNDPRYSEYGLKTRLYGRIFGIKRVSYGHVQKPRIKNSKLFSHNASTLIGCSGSPIVDLSRGVAIGVHQSGMFKKSNFGIRSESLKSIINKFPILRDVWK